MIRNSQQITTYAPHIELVAESNGNISGIRWRFVDPDAPDEALVKNTAAGIDPTWVSKIEVVKMDETLHHTETLDIDLQENAEISSAQSFSFAEIAPNDIAFVRITFADSKEKNGTNGTACYSWEFMANSQYGGADLVLSHVTKTYIEDWKTNHSYSPDGNNGAKPLFNRVEPFISSGQGDTGSLKINFKEAIAMQFDEVNSWYTWRVVEEKTVDGDTTLPLYRADAYYHIGNTDRDNDVTASFYGGAESALPGQPFTLSLGGKDVSGAITAIRSTEQQLANDCIPFLEFDEAEIAGGINNLKNIKIRFASASNPTVTVKRDAGGRNISNVMNLSLVFRNGLRHDFMANAAFEIGDDLECTATGSMNEEWRTLDDLLYASLEFQYGDAQGRGNGMNYMHYEWRFYVAGAEDTLSSYIPLAPVAQLYEVADDPDASGLTEIKPLQNAIFLTNADFENVDEIDRQKTVSAFKLEEPVMNGGGVVIGRGMALRIKEETFDGAENATTLPKTMVGLVENYAVMKIFSESISVDLLETLSDDVFELTDKDVLLKTILVIVDDVAPGDAVKPEEGAPFGYKLNDAKTILYLYDGDANGMAKDPMPLATKDADPQDPSDPTDPSNPSGSDSGCDAGFGAFALLFSIAVWAMLKRKHLK